MTSPARLTNYAARSVQFFRASGITVSGLPAATDTAGIAMLTGARDYLTSNPTATVNFVVSPTQTVTLNQAQINAMWLAVVTFIQATYTAESNIYAGINGGTITDTPGVDAVLAAIQTTY